MGTKNFIIIVLFICNSINLFSETEASYNEVIWTADLFYKFNYFCTSTIKYKLPRLTSDHYDYEFVEKQRILKKKFKNFYQQYAPLLIQESYVLLPNEVSEEQLRYFLELFHKILEEGIISMKISKKIPTLDESDSCLQIITKIELMVKFFLDYCFNLHRISTHTKIDLIKQAETKALPLLFSKTAHWFIGLDKLFSISSFFKNLFLKSNNIENRDEHILFFNESQNRLMKYELFEKQCDQLEKGIALATALYEFYKTKEENARAIAEERQNFMHAKAELLQRRKINRKKGFDIIIGRKEEKKAFEPVIAYLKKPLIFAREQVSAPHIALLYGDSGAGKTWFVHALAAETGCNLVEVGVKNYLEKKDIKKLDQHILQSFLTARQISPSILFIDEADRFLGTKRKENQALNPEYSSVQKTFNEISNILAQQLQWDASVVIVLATNKPETLDPDILNRCYLKVYLGALSEQECFDYLVRAFNKEIEISEQEEVSSYALHFETYNINALLKKIAKEAKQLLPRQLSDFVEEARRIAITNSTYTLNEHCLYEALATIKKSMVLQKGS